MAILGGCSPTARDPLLTSYDRKALLFTKALWDKQEAAVAHDPYNQPTAEEKNHRGLLKAFLTEDPVVLALKNAAAGDKRLVGVTFGYRAKFPDPKPDKSVKAAGVYCGVPEDINGFDLGGCVPPPHLGALYKLMEEYNATILSLAGLPDSIKECGGIDMIVLDAIRPRLEAYVRSGKYIDPKTKLEDITPNQFFGGEKFLDGMISYGRGRNSGPSDNSWGTQFNK